MGEYNSDLCTENINRAFPYINIKMGKNDMSKAKMKKLERKAMEIKMNKGVAIVKLANDQEDPLTVLPTPFSVYNKNGLDLKLETTRAPELDEKFHDWAYKCIETTMKPLYDAAYKDHPDYEEEFGWKTKEKKKEPGTLLQGQKKAQQWPLFILGLTWITMTKCSTVMKSRLRRLTEGKVSGGS